MNRQNPECRAPEVREIRSSGIGFSGISIPAGFAGTGGGVSTRLYLSFLRAFRRLPIYTGRMQGSGLV